jgi:predicted AlkP superfamily phosphohydrolase/phosphomutase
LETRKKELWDLITGIRKSTEHNENRFNIDNSKKHLKHLEALKQLEEDLPEWKQKIKETIVELMEIEQADKLNEVIIFITESNLKA